MDDDLPQARPATFMIRVLVGPGGSVSGHIHHLRTGERRTFDDVTELSTALLAMVHSMAPEMEGS